MPHNTMIEQAKHVGQNHGHINLKNLQHNDYITRKMDNR